MVGACALFQLASNDGGEVRRQAARAGGVYLVESRKILDKTPRQGFDDAGAA